MERCEGARERNRARIPRSGAERHCELKLFKDLIAPALGAVTGIKPLAALPGSASNPYPAAGSPLPMLPASIAPSAFGALPGGAPLMTSMLPAAMPAILGGAARIGTALGTTRVGRALGLGGSSLIAGAGGALISGAAGVLRTVAGKIRGVVLSSGRFVSSAKAAALAKRVGMEAAAVALGVSAVELAEMVLADQEKKSRRRGRGVSGADLRRTRRTIRTVERMHDQIVAACRPAMPRRSARACPPPQIRVIKSK